MALEAYYEDCDHFIPDRSFIRKSTEKGPEAEISMIRGSVFMTMMAVGYYFSRLQDRGKEDELLEIIRSEVKSTLSAMKEEAAGFLRSLNAEPG